MNLGKIIPKTITAISLGLSLHGAATATNYGLKVSQTISSSTGEDGIFGKVQKQVENAKQLYGFKIHTDLQGLGKGAPFLGDRWTSETEKQEALNTFLSILKVYPAGFIKTAFIRDVYIVKNLREATTNNKIGGYTTGGGKILVNVSGGNMYKFHHELFHRLDNNDSDSDDGIWEQINARTRIVHKNIDKTIFPLGYADDYGASGGTNEDQATIAEYLFDPEVQSQLLQRAKTDEVLRKKVMIITGSYLDKGRGGFTRDLTPTEYFDISGFKEFEYYKKWSIKYDGKVMNFNFWNKVISK